MEEKKKTPKKFKAEQYSKDCISKYNRLEGERRSQFDKDWDSIAKFFCPRKQNILSKAQQPPSEREDMLFDTNGPDALLVAAAGLLSWTTPKSEPWFSFDAPKRLRDSVAVRKWLNQCTQIAQELLANSNFYSERHESLIDKLAFGTSALFSHVSDDGKTYFENIPIGTYVIEEDYKGQVDTMIRCIQLTPKQAVQQFGEENLPPNIVECYYGNKEAPEEFLHVVKPRNPKEIKDNILSRKDEKPFASVYIHKKSGKVVEEGGFDTFPFHVGRYLSYTGTYKKVPWGYGPGFMALPEARQLNYLQKLMDIYMEKAVFPPILAPESLEGQIDISAKGVTYYNSNDGAGSDAIKALDVSGDFNVGQARIDFRREQLENKFHVDLFQMLSNRPGKQPLTAEEVRARMNEKLDAISPAFDRDVSEVIEPMLKRLFQLWLQKGLLPAPPQEAFIDIDVENNTGEIAPPDIIMSGRLALAIKNIRTQATDMEFQRLLSFASVDPTVFDVINMDKLVRGSLFDSTFFNSDYIRSEQETDQIRQARAQAQAAAQEAQMLIDTSKAIGPENVKTIAQEQGLM